MDIQLNLSAINMMLKNSLEIVEERISKATSAEEKMLYEEYRKDLRDLHAELIKIVVKMIDDKILDPKIEELVKIR